MGLRITLDSKTVEAAETEARMRHEVSRGAGIVDRQIGRQSPMVTDLVGLLGEIGFGLMFDLKRDDTVEVRSGGVDFYGKDGTAIEVKSTHHKRPHLLVPAYAMPAGGHGTKEAIDVYALMRVDYQARAVDFLGWCGRGDLIREDRLQHFNGADRLSFVLPCTELKQFEPEVERALAEDAAARGLQVSLTSDAPNV